MASASVKAPAQPSVDVLTGAYRVVSTTIKIQTDGREELYNLSKTVRDFVRSSGVRAGTVVVTSLHTTCAILINEWQEALLHDVKKYLSSLINKDHSFLNLPCGSALNNTIEGFMCERTLHTFAIPWMIRISASLCCL